MPTHPPDELLFALRNFVRAIDPKNTEPSTLYPAELNTGLAVMSAIDHFVDARVQAVLQSELLKMVPAIVAEQQRRNPSRGR
jgi:hypothetical protein